MSLTDKADRNPYIADCPHDEWTIFPSSPDWPRAQCKKCKVYGHIVLAFKPDKPEPSTTVYPNPALAELRREPMNMEWWGDYDRALQLVKAMSIDGSKELEQQILRGCKFCSVSIFNRELGSPINGGTIVSMPDPGVAFDKRYAVCGACANNPRTMRKLFGVN